MSAGGSTGVVLVALGCNLGIAVAKFAAAAWTGSSAMLSEAIHSLVDTSNQALLLIGIRRAARPADARHPFGYSREIYFWSFIVAILLFSMGAGVSIYEGVQKLAHPHPITDPFVNYVVLGVAMLLELVSAWKAVSEFRSRFGGTGPLSALKRTKDAALFTVVLEDTAALAGLTVAFAGVLVADQAGMAEADGVASLIIGLILGAVAAFMSIEIHSLIIGELAEPAVIEKIRGVIALEIGPGKPVRQLNELRTIHLGPEDILVAASLDFDDGVSAKVVEATTAQLDRAVKAAHPAVQRVLIEAHAATPSVVQAEAIKVATAPIPAPANPHAPPTRDKRRKR